ncbi:MAG: cytochrome P450 [Methyloligellaceae bacterium]
MRNAHSSTVDDMGYFIPSMPIPLTVRDEADRPKFRQRMSFLQKVMKNPLETFATVHFENPVTISKFNRSTNVIMNDVKLIRHCFLDNVNNYKHSFVRQSLLKPVLGDGLLTIEGEPWKKSRKVIAPIFIPRNVNGFADIMKRTCVDYLDNLRVGEDITMVSSKMSELTYLILSETLFSGEINEDADDMLKEVAYLLDNIGRPGIMDMLRVPLWVPRLTKLTALRSIYKFRKIIAKTIRKRKQAIAEGRDVPEDFLTLLLNAEADGNRLSLKSVEDNILTFIAAGHETTARAVTWNLYLLSKSERFRERVEAEIDAFDMEAVSPSEWINHLPWTTACFEETMRLYPPAAMITRAAVDDDEFEGYKIPKGSQIILAPWILHRHHTLWEHPERFDPERFFGENRDKIDRFAYLPFGVGPRVCIGARFAMQEGVIIMAMLLKHYRFDYAGKAPPWPVLKITLQPDNEMPMKVTQRK